MPISSIHYKIKEAAAGDIYCHLKECNNNFIPPLSARVALDDYAKKIFDNAITFEAWSDDVLVGLIAAYFNDPDNITGHITNVTILKSWMKARESMVGPG